jgi:hypothetical protein
MGVNVNPMRIRPVRAASFYSLPFSGGYGYGYAPPNMVVIEQPPSPPPFVILEPPVAPTPVQSVVHEYGPSSAPSSERSASERSAAPPAAPPASLVEPPSFGIVLKDGSVREAAAVTVQDGMVHYVDPNGEHGRVGLEAVDREATKRLNRERKLDLRSL